jgi:hypothetical protein
MLGTRLYIASAEDALLSKLEWAKMSGSERQINDVAGVIRTQANELDLEYIERWVATLRLGSQWTSAMSDAGPTGG